MNYEDVKPKLVASLIRAANSHDSGDFANIDLEYDELDRALPRGAGEEFDKLFLALSFWDGWIDARNHDWQYYEPIEKEDWPRLAMEIVKDLEANQEIQSRTVLDRFDPERASKESSFVTEIFNRLTGRT